MADTIKRGSCRVQEIRTTGQELEKTGNRKQVLRKREERKKDKKNGNIRREGKKKIESQSGRHASIS